MQYGIVFGVYPLGAFISSPFFARYGGNIGQKFLYNFGTLLHSICGLAFAFVVCIDNGYVFLGVSIFVRLLQGIGDSASWGAVLSVLMTLFPGNASKISAGTELFFGLGMTLGKLSIQYIL